MGFLVSALPATAQNAPTNARHKRFSSPSRTVHALASICAQLEVDLHRKVETLATANAITDVGVAVEAVVATVEASVIAIVDLGTIAEIDPAIKAEIVANIAGVISLIVNACVSLSLKFGCTALLDLLSKIDVCLKHLLVNLGYCVGGIIDSVLVSLRVEIQVFIKSHLHLLAAVLGVANA